ncbi:type II toxin-antitoxin system prevent-host-death family antitoxin [Streptomyces sp. NPDC006208]|uniref:type II toxin-antitoxin system prevent-host-death family antitoxin n=1 Tax=Streptomyces sp. NPDC006208 TaxID=3156734 RepID=UPI0033B03652
MSGSEVREMGVSEARANMTEVIAEARLLDVDFVLTRRDKPQAVLISVKRYEQAEQDRAFCEALRKGYAKLTPAQQKALGDDLSRLLSSVV